MSVREDALQTILRSRGAVMTERGGISVPANFGSAAGELSACVRGVGIADRRDLGKLVVTGPEGTVPALARRYVGVQLAPGGVAATREGWWCADQTDRLLLLVAADLRARLHDTLSQAARPRAITVVDASQTLASLAVAGRQMHHLLALLGIVPPTGDLRSVAPYSAVQLAGIRVRLLLESDQRALLITDAAHADEVWQAAETAGRPLGLTLVGLEALERFALFETMQRRHMVAA
jgi:glycine cleavage system aminomethyltransferase T